MAYPAAGTAGLYVVPRGVPAAHQLHLELPLPVGYLPYAGLLARAASPAEPGSAPCENRQYAEPTPLGGSCVIDWFSCQGDLPGDVVCSMLSNDCLPSRTCAPDADTRCAALGTGDECQGADGTCADGPVIFHHGGE